MRLTAPLQLLGSMRKSDRLWLTAAVLNVFAIEVVGHGSRSEWWDLAAVGLVAAFGFTTARWHDHSPLRVVSSLERSGPALGRAIVASLSSFGLDLRGRPALPHRLPPFLLGAAFAGGAGAFALLTFGTLVDLRATLVDRLYFAYVAVVAAVWFALALGIVASLGLFVATLHDEWVLAFGRQGRLLRRRLLFGACVVIAGVGFVVPPEFTAVVLVGVATLSGLWFPLAPKLTLVWRSRRTNAVSAMSFGALNVTLWTIFGLAAVQLILLTTASSSPSVGELPFTRAFGAIFGGYATAAFVGLQVQSALTCWRESRMDPAQPCSPTVRIDGELSEEARDYVSTGLERFGWRVRSLRESFEESDLALRFLTHDPPRLDPRSDPIALTVHQLDDASTVELLEREDVRRKRARLKSAMRELLEHAFQPRFSDGTGYWVNPHLWFAGGVSRDTTGDEIVSDNGLILVDFIGQHFRHAMPRPVRHHVAVVFAAVEIDLVYLQDGVSFDHYWAVMERIFEFYDDAPRRIEDAHLGGLPGVRALVHDFVIEEPWIKSEDYPEPDYDEIGRARILHLFKDLGEEDETAESDDPKARIPRPRSLLPV